MSAPAFDISGVWHGLYNFPRDLPPVFFEAALHDADGWLTGAITEKVVLNGQDQVLESIVQGRRAGRFVTWLKTYAAILKTYDAVRYEGSVNDDASEIACRWHIPGNWSGTFLMVREPGKRVATSMRIEEKNVTS